MAKNPQKSTVVVKKDTAGKKNRKGIHSKKKASTLKSSKNYQKPYIGQGR